MDTEDKYQEIREKLRTLPKMKASDDFFIKLQHRINLLDSGELPAETIQEHKAAAESKSFWIFKKPLPAWLIPAAGFGIVLVIVFTFWMIYKGTSDFSEQKIAEQKTGDQTVTIPVEQSTPESKKPDEISGKDLAVDMDREKAAEEKLPSISEPKKDELPVMKEPVDKISNEKTEDTKALPPLNSSNNGQKVPETMIKDEKIEAKEPEMKKEDERTVIKDSEKRNINAIKSEKGIDFKDNNDLLKEKTGVMEEKKKNKDGIRSKIDSVKKGFDK